jgi:bifunctional DNA-binding transcriptional regulator/antitoxin component of YhaV-PrlF toxin-antitoxin module
MGVKVKVGPKYQVVIPQTIRKKIPLVPKKKVLVEEINGVIFILPRPSSFTEFMIGLGKEAWKGVDPKGYVKKERETWE